MSQKHCRLCGKTLPLDAFHRDRTARDGRQARCKTCNTAVCADYRKRHPESTVTRSRLARERHPERMLRHNARWKAAHPQAHLAHQKVYRAVKSGRLVKPDTCSACGRHGVRLEAHHRDYSRPLEITWLCCACHANIGKAGETASSGEAVA